MNNQINWADAEYKAARLRSLILGCREVLEGHRIATPSPRESPAEVEIEPLGVKVEADINQINQTLNDLNKMLQVSEQESSVPQLGEEEFWSLGSVELHGEPKPIRRGYLVPTFRALIAEQPSQNLLAFLIRIGGEKDLIERERHDHFGIHYHYLDRKKRRSSAILCWDIRACGANQLRPLFHEEHGAGRYHFSARPDLWGQIKRKSMHDACQPDLDRWPLNEFKAPSLKALAVWPLHAILTPLSATPPKGDSVMVTQFRRRPHKSKRS